MGGLDVSVTRKERAKEGSVERRTDPGRLGQDDYYRELMLTGCHSHQLKEMFDILGLYTVLQRVTACHV